MVMAIALKNQVLLENLTQCVEKYLNSCGRRWVDLEAIFSTMKV